MDSTAKMPIWLKKYVPTEEEKEKNHSLRVPDDYPIKPLDVRNAFYENDRVPTMNIHFCDVSEEYLNEYNGSYYFGIRNNPYAILVKANPDKDGVVATHEDTLGIYDKAFKHINWDYSQVSLKKLIIGKNVVSLLDNLSRIKVEDLIIYSKSKSFLLKDITRFSSSKYIFIPNIPLSSFIYSEIKPNLVAGYLKYGKEYNMDIDIVETYERYINNHVNNLYEHSLLVPELLDCLLERKLIPYEDIRNLILSSKKDSLAQKKLEQYRDAYFLEEEKNGIDLKNLLEEIKRTCPINNDKDFEAPKVVKKEFGFSQSYINPFLRKYFTNVRSKIKVGDIFATTYMNETLLLKVVGLGNQYNQEISLKPIFIAIGDKKYDLTLYDEDYNLVDESKLLSNQSLVQLGEENKLGQVYFDYKSSFLFCLLIDCGFVSLPNLFQFVPSLGLFDRAFYEDSYITFPTFDNSVDVVAGKEMVNFFEPFFYVRNIYANELGDFPFVDDIDRNYVVFRKIKSDNYYEASAQLYNLGKNFVVDALDLKCSVQCAYDSYQIVGENYTNNSGNTYLLTDILKFMHKMIAVADRSLTEKMIIMYFSDFYQRTHDIKYEGFSSDEIRELLNKYFNKNVIGGFYVGYDTTFIKDDKFYCFDEEWFGIFYDAVKRSKKPITKLEDLPIYQRHEKLFRLQCVPRMYFNIFLECAVRAISKDRFMDLVKEFIISII